VTQKVGGGVVVLEPQQVVESAQEADVTAR
jgi:hypothetical protein